jgi:transcriptional regulator with XRE-family HTH domain
MTKRKNIFGNNLKYLRTRAGLTQDDLLPLLGIKRSTWANYEKGTSTPYVHELMKISDFWGIDETNLLRNADLPKLVEKGTIRPNEVVGVQEPLTRYADQGDEVLLSLEDMIVQMNNLIAVRKQENKERKKNKK